MLVKFFLICFIFTFPFVVAAKLVNYKLDRAHSSINFSVNHLGIVPVEGKFDDFEGSFKYNTKTKEITNIFIKVDVDSIDTNESDRDTHLKSNDFFGVRDKFANIVKKRKYIIFKSKKAKISQKRLKGTLQILDTKKKVSFKADMKALSGMIGGVFKLSINRHHYRLTWQKPNTGILKKVAGKSVGDIVKIKVNVLAKTK